MLRSPWGAGPVTEGGASMRLALFPRPNSGRQQAPLPLEFSLVHVQRELYAPCFS